MKFRSADAEVYVPDGASPAEAMRRSTHLAIGAHQDDIPIMAFDGILRSFARRTFLALTVGDGAGSPRTGDYAAISDEEMRSVRRAEERRAAEIGHYGAAIQLGYPTAAIRDGSRSDVVDDLATIFDVAQPEVVYTHNLADKHDTHVATALRTITAIRTLPPERRPRSLYGCEVWRDLDWVIDTDKVVFDVADTADLFPRLMSVYESQVAAGKRYDRAAEGRRRAHATFLTSYAVDAADAISFAMDLTPLIVDSALDPGTYVAGYIARMGRDVAERISRVT